ncbi:MAG: FG-GAP repeat protein [Candidatus Aceula meridiana]|nr:FG-GAP repeat protein [Candidatus Aceula meridiana]
MKKILILGVFIFITLSGNGLCSEGPPLAPKISTYFSDSDILKSFSRNTNPNIKPGTIPSKDGSFGIVFPETKIIGDQGSRMGCSVSISGDYFVVGAPQDNIIGISSGSARIYEHESGTGWVCVKQLVPCDGGNGDSFGTSVAIFGDYAIVGAYHDDGIHGYRSGSAYIYERNGSGNWNFISKLFASDGETNDEFGTTVAISGDYAIVGAPAKNLWHGAIYVFKRDALGNWSEDAKLLSGSSMDMVLGSSISISGDYVAAGVASGVDKVIIYKRSAAVWALHSQITDLWNSYTHLRCAISGDYLIVGTPFGMNGGNPHGAAYIYKRNGTEWIAQTTFLPNSGDDNFGQSVFISGNYAIVGSREASIFARHVENWHEVTRQSTDFPGDMFGSSVSLSEKHFVAGAPHDWASGPFSGAVYIYKNIIQKHNVQKKPAIE